MTIKEQLMKDSWDYDFPMSNRHAESIENIIYNFSVDFLNDIKEYEKESGNRICDDERNSFELLDIYIKKRNL
jgi:hypothetical protein